MQSQDEIDYEIHKKMLTRTKYSESNKYSSVLTLVETERAIKEIKWFFSK
jgi:hypothetical protein